MMHAFLYGVILAIGLIMPLGMQNIFLFNQGATQPSSLLALPSVITAFLCDCLLVLSAIFGVSLVILTIPWLKNAFFVVGICFLSYIGYLTWRTQHATTQTRKPLSIKQQIIFAASVSLLNPHAILDTMSVIGTNSLQFSGDEKIAYTLACMLVSFCWFLSLSIAGRYVKKLDPTENSMNIINKISAIIMWGVAVYLGWQLM